MFVTLLILAALAAVAPGQDWPMLGHDPQRTHGSAVSVEPPYVVTWTWPPTLTGPGAASHALSPFAQPVVATVPTDPLTIEPPSADHPTEPDARTHVFIGTMTGQVWALDAATGAKAWQTDVDGPVMSSPAVVGRRVFVACADGRVYAFDSADGVKLWQRDLGAPLMCSPLPVGSRLLIAGRDARAYALDVATGEPLWSTPLDAPAAGSCAYADGRVYLATHAATAYALSERDGEILWKRTLRGQDPWYTPVVAGKAVIVRTRSAAHGPGEDGMETVLRALPPATDTWPPKDWLLERAAIAGHLEQPDERNCFVLDRETGKALFTPAVTRVGGADCPPWPAVSPTGVVYVHRRVRSTRMKGALNFGSRYPIDFDEIDLDAGDRKPLAALPPNDDVAPRVKLADMNRTHYATIGGRKAYFYHARIGCFALDLLTGEAAGILRPRSMTMPAPEGTTTLLSKLWAATPGRPRFAEIASGVVPAAGALFINLPTVGCLVRIDGNNGRNAPPQPRRASEPPSSQAATDTDTDGDAAGGDQERVDKRPTAEPAESPALRDRPPLPKRVPATIAINEVLTPGNVPLDAQPLQKRLVAQIHEIVDGDMPAPAYYLAGRKHPTWLFDSPADLVWALCEAWPFLPGALKPKVRAYLQATMKAHPLWEDKPLCADGGRRREYFPITSENRETVTAISRLKEAKLRRLYALWLYAHRTGDVAYIRKNWPTIASFAAKGLKQIDAYGPTYADLTGLIGLARLARLAEQTDLAMSTITDIARLGKILSDIEAFRSRFDERSRLVIAPNYVRVKDRPAALGVLLVDLVPAAVRVMDAEALAAHRDAVAAAVPHWFIGIGGPTYGEDVWAGAVTMPPHVPAGYFQLHAWLGQSPPEQLARWVDVPCVRVGDCFHIRKLAAALMQASKPGYAPLQPPDAND
jgi:hypothetical protein